MKKTLIKNARITNEGRTFNGSVLIEGETIAAVYEDIIPESDIQGAEIIDATGKWLLPGMIDDQVHFREPGLTHKGDIKSESSAAVAGGITTFMEMPNTKPQTTNIEALEWKLQRGAETSVANYSFFLGGTNDNMEEIRKIDQTRVPGLKLFLGSSTGNMLVDNKESLEKIFSEAGVLIAVHAEKEEIIKQNIAHYQKLHGEDLGISFHPLIRSEEACYASSSEAIEMAERLNTRLHVLHLSTAKEMKLFSNKKPLKDKKITAEVCVQHLWFCDEDYHHFGNKIKWNPAIKTAEDRKVLREALIDNRIDIVATDHAPHLLEEKTGGCLQAASGGPMVQHALPAMLDMMTDNEFSIEKIVEKTAHAPAELYQVDRRGYIRPGYYADLVLIDPNDKWTVSMENILYKCKWSPFDGYTFRHSVWKTFVNGQLTYSDKQVNDFVHGMEVKYNR